MRVPEAGHRRWWKGGVGPEGSSVHAHLTHTGGPDGPSTIPGSGKPGGGGCLPPSCDVSSLLALIYGWPAPQGAWEDSGCPLFLVQFGEQNAPGANRFP